MASKSAVGRVLAVRVLRVGSTSSMIGPSTVVRREQKIQTNVKNFSMQARSMNVADSQSTQSTSQPSPPNSKPGVAADEAKNAAYLGEV
jgi:hypothetical protein